MPLSHSEILSRMRVDDGVYVLGCGQRRVTVFSQQVRALNFAYALLTERARDVGSTRVAVVGAGIGGLMLVAALGRHNVRADLLERETDILRVLQNSEKRYLHPHLYDWPAKGWSVSRTEFGILDWS